MAIAAADSALLRVARGVAVSDELVAGGSYMQNVRSELIAGAALGAAMLTAFGLSAPPAQAGYIVTLDQVGSNVVATGSGTLDVTDLESIGSGTAPAGVEPDIGAIFTGPAANTVNSKYGGLMTGPTRFGTGALTDASTGSGSFVGMIAEVQTVAVPSGYVSGTSLSDTATYDSATFASLGVTPGTYEWTWGSGAHADSFTLDIQAAPAPLIGHGLLVFLAVGGVLFGSKLLERRREARLQSG